MSGFTLLEVVIALIITAIAATALLTAAGSALQATRTASMVDQAIVRAKSRLTAAVHGTRLEPGDWSGDDGGGFRWRLHVAPLATASPRPDGIAATQSSAAVPVVLYGVSVWVAWTDGGVARQVRLDTEAVGGT